MESVKILRYTILLATLICAGAIAVALPAKSVHDVASSAKSARDWHDVRVLHIGDSHLENWGLKGTLKRKFKQAGATYSVYAWKGSSSRSWLRSGKLRRVLQKTAPHVVIVNLGTNISRADDPSQYSGYVRRVAERIAPRECYWVAPPPLIEDKNGFYDMLQAASKPCVFLDSREIEFEIRQSKVFHLDKRQSTIWAKQIWKWLNGRSVHPERGNGV